MVIQVARAPTDSDRDDQFARSTWIEGRIHRKHSPVNLLVCHLKGQCVHLDNLTSTGVSMKDYANASCCLGLRNRKIVLMSHHARECETDHILESRSFGSKIKEMSRRVCGLTIRGPNSPNSLSAWNGRPHKVKFRHESWKVTKTQESGQEETLALDRGGSSLEMKKGC